MSTQKRDHRSQPTECTQRERVGCIPIPAQIARYVCAAAMLRFRRRTMLRFWRRTVRTAPLMSILWSAWAWAATKFLHSDHQSRQLVRPVVLADRRGSPPLRVRNRAAMGKQASPRSSIPHSPYPSGLVRIHRILPLGLGGPPGLLEPQAPAGYRRRAERYDGKRDMYFQHAA
jgi:hypothetical protein